MVTKTAEVFKLTSGKAPFVYEIYQNTRINVGVNGPTGKTISSLQFDMSQSSFGLRKPQGSRGPRVARRPDESSDVTKFVSFPGVQPCMACGARVLRPVRYAYESPGASVSSTASLTQG